MEGMTLFKTEFSGTSVKHGRRISKLTRIVKSVLRRAIR